MFDTHMVNISFQNFIWHEIGPDRKEVPEGKGFSWSFSVAHIN